MYSATDLTLAIPALWLAGLGALALALLVVILTRD